MFVKYCSRLSHNVPALLSRPIAKFSSQQNKHPHQVVKKFNPSLGATGEASITQSITRTSPKKINIEEVISERRKKEAEDTRKIRKLNMFDKWILVKLGKYSSMKDVPDQVVYKNIQFSKEDREKVKADMYEKGFKYFIFADYTLWILCISVCGPLFYFYYFKQDKISKADTGAHE